MLYINFFTDEFAGVAASGDTWNCYLAYALQINNQFLKIWEGGRGGSFTTLTDKPNLQGQKKIGIQVSNHTSPAVCDIPSYREKKISYDLQLFKLQKLWKLRWILKNWCILIKMHCVTFLGFDIENEDEYWKTDAC